MRATLRSIVGAGITSSVAAASRSLELAWHQLCSARDAFCNVTPGDTDELFRARDCWVQAMHGYDAAVLRHATVVKRSQSRRWLRVVGGET